MHIYMLFRSRLIECMRKYVLLRIRFIDCIRIYVLLAPPVGIVVLVAVVVIAFVVVVAVVVVVVGELCKLGVAPLVKTCRGLQTYPLYCRTPEIESKSKRNLYFVV